MADMRRHVEEVHGSPKHCPEPGCTWRGAKRGERLEEHKMKAHPEIYNGDIFPECRSMYADIIQKLSSTSLKDLELLLPVYWLRFPKMKAQREVSIVRIHPHSQYQEQF
jgi:hypothetical protein